MTQKLSVLLAYLTLVLVCFACSDDFTDMQVLQQQAQQQSSLSPSKETKMADFARVLSKAVADRQDVRQFLKDEALKQFDRNYDILYGAVKDEQIGGVKFHDILSSYSTVDSLNDMTAGIPLLNIYLTRTAIFGIFPEDLDVNDEEVPIAVSMSDSTRFFVNGTLETTMAKGEIPAFHVFVVNENSRVVVNNGVDYVSNGLKALSRNDYTFKSPLFDARLDNNLKSIRTNMSVAGRRVHDAFQYFHGAGHGSDQKAFQRDYLYYGITPYKQTGTLNASTSEYLCYIKVSPRAYFKIADVMPTGSIQEDPICEEQRNPSDEHWVAKYKGTDSQKRKLTQEELVDKLWTKGAYELRFDIIDSKQGEANVIYVPVRPEEIWNFNLDIDRQHKTWFRHTKSTYKIDPKKFTSKEYFLPEAIDLGKWDISTESMYRSIRVSEEDDGEEVTTKYSYEIVRMSSHNFKGSTKLNVGFGTSDKNSLSGEFSSEATRQNTSRQTSEVSIKETNASDFLGKVTVYYYDPIVESMTSGLVLHTYNTGYVTFAITVR